MRRPLAPLLSAAIGLGLLGLVATSVVPGNAIAQTLAIGDGARVAAGAGSTINVRSEPVVQRGNVVTTVRGGTLVHVQASEQRGDFVWYNVASLADAETPFEGWIRGDLLARADLPNDIVDEAQTASEDDTSALAEAAAAAEATEAPVPFEERADWSRNIIRLYPAISGCVRVGSAPPITVLRAMVRSRGLAEVFMSDSAGRRWDCVIRENGGTPVRYDPLSGAVLLEDDLGKQPFFSTEEERPDLDPACHRIEQVNDPDSGEQLGWLYYWTCG